MRIQRREQVRERFGQVEAQRAIVWRGWFAGHRHCRLAECVANRKAPDDGCRVACKQLGMHELYEAVIWPKNDGRSPVPEENPAAETDANLQVAFWLTGISPRYGGAFLVPTSFTLCELHGVIQVAMGREGVYSMIL